MESSRKGIILAGGCGTRLYPMTESINKQLLPIYDKPMIYYPLSTLMLAGITDILIITNPDKISHFQQLLDDGSRLGISIRYASQDKPRGIADAFLIGENIGFLNNNPVALVLGDNIFYGDDFYEDLANVSYNTGNCIFGYRVANPEEYGVVEFVRDGNKITVKGIEEKPEYPKTNYAVPGLYFYDNTVATRVRSLAPSDRGELEITDLNRSYLLDNDLNVNLLGHNAAWFDTGNSDAMFEAAMFVKSIQSRTGNMIGCIEEAAYKRECISKKELHTLIRNMPLSQYKRQLREKYQVLQYV